MFASCLENVEFTAFVTVGDLTLEVVVVARVDAVLQARGRRARHVGHGHEAHFVELVEFVGQVEQSVPLVRRVRTRVVVVAVESKAVTLNASACVTTVFAVLVVAEVLAPLEAHDVAQRTAKQSGAVAHAQAVAPVDGRGAAVHVPGVAEALANLRQLEVVLGSQGLHAF